MEFGGATELVAGIEKRALEYKPPEKIPSEFERRMEISPPAFTQMVFLEALASYDRVEKILGAARVEEQLIARPEKLPLPVPKKAKEIPKPKGAPPEKVPEEAPPEIEFEEEKPAIPAKPPKPAVEGEKVEIPIEFETPPETVELEKTVEEKVEEAKPPPPPVELTHEEIAPGVKKEEAAPPPTTPGTLIPEVELSAPALILQSPEAAAAESLGNLRSQFKAEMKGTKVDKEDIKKRMLELTRQLFREKSVERREQLKKEIVTFKNLIPSAGRVEGDIADALRKDQEYDLSTVRKAVESACTAASAPLFKAADEQIALGKGEQAYSEFTARCGELKDKLNLLTASSQEFLLKKHNAELDALEKEAKGKSLKEIKKIRGSLPKTYGEHFSSLQSSLSEQIDSEVERRKVLVAPQPLREKDRTVIEISGMGDEELLTDLQKEDAAYYNMYSRGEISRTEALARARQILAKKAKLDEATINKYFGGKSK